MGYDVLSMNSTNLPKIKAVMRQLSYAQMCDLLEQSLKLESARQIRDFLQQALVEAGVERLLRPSL
jgi:phosphotransferase system enzyme I (PtsP)